MKTIETLNTKKESRKKGEYIFKIKNTTFICYNTGLGYWCLDTLIGGQLDDSYGHQGLNLKSCKQMIVMEWNNGNIR